ncbi:tannase/feruloyl esterase family alpha/beta hydrolase [Caldimonas tepidiphila]|uniref:tannase/feruloyl esterase family alpha/beta hydrolase n=1 Tax=Caldimonas tepidiphila TaxID=2315841 RepID=UPI00130079F9|nr:tannase/feruloyl esterase family alpha/beta hydrolase [Caldimonas tepidiphila]
MQFPHPRPTAYAASLFVAISVAACGGGDKMSQEELACASLAGTTIDKAQIGLPSSGARITSATLVRASSETNLPEHCDVRGAIAPVDATKGYDINFRVNLPSGWNEKAMHFGGSGYNGTVVAATGPAPSAPRGAPVPLARGYATFGSDSGHVGGNAQFGVREEALENFGYAQMKKTRDVAVELMKRRYGKTPTRTYWVGSSQGGREGLTVAQRFPADYDGVLARVPVLSFTGLQLQGNRVAQAIAANNGAGWLNEAEVNLVQDRVRQAGDTVAADGLVDGIIANYGSCQFDPVVLRCAGGADTGDTCLSDAQINTLNALHTPMQFGFPVANGVTQYQGWGWGGENDPLNNWLSWVTGTDANGGRIASLGNQFVRYFIAQDAPGFDPLSFNRADWQARIQQVSPIIDATDPDLSAFHARGGKLIMQEFGADYARSPNATIAYHDSVVQRMTPQTADQFLRLYFTPGADHGGIGGSGWPATSVDWVTVLENWVEKGQAPGDKLTQTAHAATAPFAQTAERPLCRYPLYARYNGSGDVNQAASYTCTAPSAP